MTIEHLINQIPIDGLMVALLEANQESESIEDRIFTVPDIDLLKRFFPSKQISKAILGSYESQLAITFALKHQLTQLQVHLNELSRRESKAKNETQCFLRTLFEDRPIPLVGFSSIGAHIQYRNTRACRAFDYYDIKDCSLPRTSGVYCHSHQSEDWQKVDTPYQSTQAKMFRFYGDTKNLGEYNEDDLKKMVDDFWTNFATSAVFINGTTVDLALTTMGIANLEELNAMGQGGLRKRFLDLAKKSPRGKSR